jgi:alpha-L-rhamnosidase
VVVGTGGHWQTAAGPVVEELLFAGERSVSGDPPRWESATAVPGPRGMLRPAALPPVRAQRRLLPTRTTSAQAGSLTVHDFGEVVAGRVRCLISGDPGAEVRITYGEELSADGRVICDNELAVGPAQTDVHHLVRRVDRLEWQTHFGYRGFRWVQIETTGNATVEDVTAITMHTDVTNVGSFDCDEPVLTWINSALLRWFLNNLHGIPTDTPIYEKNGWTADAHLATEALVHHTDLRSTFTKWLDDHADAQDSTGVVPNIVPTPGWGRMADPAWGASAVLIPWHLYWEYGDLDILRRFAPMAERYADALREASAGGLWPSRSWGDWLPPGHTQAPEGAAPTATMMMVSVLQHTAKVLTSLGRADAARTYIEAAACLSAVYHDTYFDPATSTYHVPGLAYRQTMNILPLAFDAVPMQHRDRVFQGIVDDIEERTNGHLDCGAIGVRHLLPVLSMHGRDDLALTVLTRRTRPGWGVWFEAGETTLLESWDADARSRNHYFLGSVAAWIQQRVGGLRCTEPGWSRMHIEPVRDRRVLSASIRHRTARGDAAMSWRRVAGRWNIEAIVPAGSVATVGLADRPVLGEGHHRLSLPDTTGSGRP